MAANYGLDLSAILRQLRQRKATGGYVPPNFVSNILRANIQGAAGRALQERGLTQSKELQQASLAQSKELQEKQMAQSKEQAEKSMAQAKELSERQMAESGRQFTESQKERQREFDIGQQAAEEERASRERQGIVSTAVQAPLAGWAGYSLYKAMKPGTTPSPKPDDFKSAIDAYRNEGITSPPLDPERYLTDKEILGGGETRWGGTSLDELQGIKDYESIGIERAPMGTPSGSPEWLTPTQPETVPVSYAPKNIDTPYGGYDYTTPGDYYSDITPASYSAPAGTAGTVATETAATPATAGVNQPNFVGPDWSVSGDMSALERGGVYAAGELAERTLPGIKEVPGGAQKGIPTALKYTALTGSPLIGGTIGAVEALGTEAGIKEFEKVEEPLNFVESAAGAAGEGMWDIVSDIGGGVGKAVGTVICTELHRQGYLNESVYENDAKFRQKITDETYAGYRILADPVVGLMQRSRLFTAVFAPFAVAVAREMAHRMNPEIKGTIFGKVFLKAIIPVCERIGRNSGGLKVLNPVIP